MIIASSLSYSASSRSSRTLAICSRLPAMAASAMIPRAALAGSQGVGVIGAEQPQPIGEQRLERGGDG